jgi:glycerol dehydrogenase-like iron-containing ADH family enzyme
LLALAGDLLIGVGGTSVLDITKLAAHKKNVRYVLFSTGIANNGMGSSIASIYVKGKKETFPARTLEKHLHDGRRLPRCDSELALGDK